jgi:hypothetical protein
MEPYGYPSDKNPFWSKPDREAGQAKKLRINAHPKSRSSRGSRREEALTHFSVLLSNFRLSLVTSAATGGGGDI